MAAHPATITYQRCVTSLTPIKNPSSVSKDRGRLGYVVGQRQTCEPLRLTTVCHFPVRLVGIVFPDSSHAARLVETTSARKVRPLCRQLEITSAPLQRFRETESNQRTWDSSHRYKYRLSSPYTYRLPDLRVQVNDFARGTRLPYPAGRDRGAPRQLPVTRTLSKWPSHTLSGWTAPHLS